MDNQVFTKEEKSFIKSLKSAFKKCPNTLRIYSTGDELLVCKAGVPSDILLENIISRGLNVGVFLTDMHEDRDNGEENSPIVV